MNLSADERNHVPGWLLQLLDDGNLYDVSYAERYCSSRYVIDLLSQRRAELEADTIPESLSAEPASIEALREAVQWAEWIMTPGGADGENRSPDAYMAARIAWFRQYARRRETVAWFEQQIRDLVDAGADYPLSFAALEATR